MSKERNDDAQAPIPGTDTERQPNETPTKQYAQAERTKFEQYEKEQRDHGRDNLPNAVDPQHGAKVRDKGSHR